MRTHAQIEAARANGAESKGPISIEARAKPSPNALKFQAFANSLVLATESQPDFLTLAADLTGAFRPANAAERAIVDRIIDATWRERRIRGLERSALNLEIEGQRTSIDQAYESISNQARTSIAFSKLHNTGKTLSASQSALNHCSRQFSRAVRDLERLRKSAALLTPAPPPEPQPKVKNEPGPRRNIALVPKPPNPAASRRAA